MDGDVRFDNVPNDFGRSVEHSVSARRRVGIQRPDYRFHQPRKVRVQYQRVLAPSQ